MTDQPFNYITTPQQAEEAIKWLKGADRLALDCETSVLPEWEGRGGSALDPHTGTIALLMLLQPDGIPQIFDLEWLRHHQIDFQPLVNLLTSVPYLVGANIKFDIKFILSTLGTMPTNVRDVIVMAKLISNATGSKVGKQHGHGYADLCREYLNIHISGKKTLRESSWGIGLESRNLENSWWLEKLHYGAADVLHLFPLHDIMEEVLTTPMPDSPLSQTGWTQDRWGLGMRASVEREHEFLPVVASMEYNGLPVSVETMAAFQAAISDKLVKTAVYLCRELSLDTPQRDWRGQEVPSTKALKTLRSSQGLLGCIQKALQFSRIDNVQAEVLKRMLEILDKLSALKDPDSEVVTADPIFIDEAEEDLFSEFTQLERSELIQKAPVVEAILVFKKCCKQESMDLGRFINPKTKRLHYSLDQLGAATGRCIAAGMRVLTVGGSYPIEEIKVGDFVYCYDDQGKVRIRKVLNVWTRGKADLVKVKWQSSALKGHTGFVICTPDHKFLTKDSGWVEAQNLKRYQKIYHLARRRHLDSGRKLRPRLYGTNCYQETEQIAIKREFFRCEDPKMHIHHKDGDSSNNCLENLEILSGSQHTSHHNKLLRQEGKMKWEHLRLYKPTPKSGVDHPCYIKVSKFSLLRMIAKAHGRPSKVEMDFDTYRRKCKEADIDLRQVEKRYSKKKGIYLNKRNILLALQNYKTVEKASQSLGIGTRALKAACLRLEVPYENHSVTSVRPHGKGFVYDLEVEEFHNFICEELCVANSSSASPNMQQVSGRVTATLDLPDDVLFRCSSHPVPMTNQG